MKKNLFAILVAVLALASSGAHAAFEACLDLFPGKIVPQVSSKAKLRDICFDSFAVLHSGETKTAVFTIEKMNRGSVAAARKVERTNRFYEEARLPRAERATLEDYRGSGFDRGHLAAAGNMSSPEAMAQSFSLANMVPQAPENNRGAWARNVEAATRHYVQRAKGDVFVFTGPAHKGPVKRIGSGNVWVPTHLYKLVYDPVAGRAWAYWVENTDTAKVTKPISYQELVGLIGIELLPGVMLKP